MTNEEIMQQAKQEIEKREVDKKNSNFLSSLINSGTDELVQAQRASEIEKLQEQQKAYEEVYKRPNPNIQMDIDKLKNLALSEQTHTKSIDNILSAIQFSNDVDKKRESFLNEFEKSAFDRGIKQVGSTVFMEALNKSNNNVFQALADVNGCKNIFELAEKEQKSRVDMEYIATQKKDDREYISKLAKEVAKELSKQFKAGH